VAWGVVRDAVAGLHNLETLLRSPRVSAKTLASVLPELLASCARLRDAFTMRSGERSRDAQIARAVLSDFTLERVDALERAMSDAASAELDTRTRLALEQVVSRVSVDLDASAELLDLADRAEHPAPTELSLGGIARVALASPSARGGRGEPEIGVRFDGEAAEDCVLSADPHVLTRLVAFAAARVHAAGAAEVTLRAHVDDTHAHLSIEPSAPGDARSPSFPTRLVRRIEATDLIVEAAARAAGIAVDASGSRVTYVVRRVV
jgi:hypothetical protein